MPHSALAQRQSDKAAAALKAALEKHRIPLNKVDPAYGSLTGTVSVTTESCHTTITEFYPAFPGGAASTRRVKFHWRSVSKAGTHPDLPGWVIIVSRRFDQTESFYAGDDLEPAFAAIDELLRSCARNLDVDLDTGISTGPAVPPGASAVRPRLGFGKTVTLGPQDFARVTSPYGTARARLYQGRLEVDRSGTAQLRFRTDDMKLRVPKPENVEVIHEASGVEIEPNPHNVTVGAAGVNGPQANDYALTYELQAGHRYLVKIYYDGTYCSRSGVFCQQKSPAEPPVLRMTVSRR